MSKLLSIKNFSIDYCLSAGPVHAVRQVNIELSHGERVGIVGESGSGKTTLALALMGMLRSPGRVVGGSAHLEGIDLLALDPNERESMRLAKVSYVPQGAMNSLNPIQTVGRSIRDGFFDHGTNLSPRELDEKVRELLESVGLSPEIAHSFPHELSGGMKQRVCIAISISLKPKLILADEPTSALDVVTQRFLMQTLQRLQESLGSGMILIGHDMGLMAQSVDRIVVMKDGSVVEQGKVSELLGNPQERYTKDLIASVPQFGERGRKAPLSPRPRTIQDEPIIEIRAATKAYPGRKRGKAVVALQPLDLTVSSDPKILSIVGESGSGKSTLAGMMLGSVAPSSGEICHQGHSIGKLRGRSLLNFRREVQAIFQDPYSSFNPFYRVDRTLMTPLLKLGVASSRSEAREMIEASCTQVGLDPELVTGRFAHQLSGGQRQRLMVARALMLRPKLLIADEPVSMVDASLRMNILEALKALRDEYGIVVIYITHDLATAYRVSDAVIVLQKGHVVEKGGPDQVLRNPQHPYTQMLVDSIPWPDPKRAWGANSGHTELSSAN